VRLLAKPFTRRLSFGWLSFGWLSFGLRFLSKALAWAQFFVCLMVALVRDQRGDRDLRFGGVGLTMRASGTLNGSSPTANLASVNIKGKWGRSIFPPALIVGSHSVLIWK